MIFLIFFGVNCKEYFVLENFVFLFRFVYVDVMLNILCMFSVSFIFRCISLIDILV